MPKIKEHSKNIMRLTKGEELLFWILHKIMDMVCLSVDVRQRNVAFNVVHVQFVLNRFYVIPVR